MGILDIFRKRVKQIFKKEKESKKEFGPYMIEIENVVKEFNGNKPLDGVNLKVRRGETVAVIGPSGCGKSTLLRLIIRLFFPNKGKIVVAGKDISKLEEEEINELREKIGMVFQSSALFDSLSVGENVAFGLREHPKYNEDEIKKKTKEKLALVDLEGKEDLMPSELSGGMQKRVSLARAIAVDPEIILYDEPTTGLDPVTASAIEDLILDLHQKLKITAIVVTHQMSTVYRIADRITMLHDGKIIEVGTPEEAKNTKDPIVKNFITGKHNNNKRLQ